MRLAVDESAYFSSDSVGVRATMRVGFAFPHEAAISETDCRGLIRTRLRTGRCRFTACAARRSKRGAGFRRAADPVPPLRLLRNFRAVCEIADATMGGRRRAAGCPGVGSGGSIVPEWSPCLAANLVHPRS